MSMAILTDTVRTLEDPYIVWASGFILTKPLPKESFRTEYEQADWLLTYVTELYEHYDADKLYKVIDNLADMARSTFIFKENSYQ